MLVFPSALKLYKIHNKGPIICQLNVEFEDFQPVKFCENSNLANALKKKPLICSKRFLTVCAMKLFCSTFTSELNIFQVWIQKGFERSVGWELGCCGRCQVGFIIRMPKTIFEFFVFFVNLKFRDHLQCYIWVGLDGMVILDHRYSESTFGANKKGGLPLISDDNSISMKNLEHIAFH